MSMKAASSVDVLASELSLFDTFPTNSGVEQIQWVEYRPLNQLTGDNPIEFNISGAGPHYLDLRRTLLHIKAKIVKADGSDVPVEEFATPVNLYLQSLWRQVDVEIQQQMISSTGVNYAYKAMLDVLLNFGNDAKESQLQTQLYFHDSAGSMDSTNPQGADNLGLFYRDEFSGTSKTVDLEGPLYESIFETDRYMLNGVDIRIKLQPTSDAFRLMSSGSGYKVIIMDAILKVCKVSVSPDVMVAHADMLKTVTAKYPYYRTETKTFNISQGQYNFNIDNCFNGRIPTKLTLVMMKSMAYAGSYNLNPYNFIHNNIDYLSLDIDGQTVPSKPLRPKFSKQGGQNYISAYQSLFSHMWNKNEGNNIVRSDFPDGYSIFVFDIEADIEEKFKNMLPLIKTGNLKIEGHFEEPPGEAVTILLLAKFPAQFEIDETRSILI